MQSAAFNVTQRGNAAFSRVNRHECIAAVLFFVHRFENSSRCREKSCAAVFAVVGDFFRLNSGLTEHQRELVKGQHSVNKALIMGGFVLFCNAGADENDLCAGNALFNVRRVRLHWRKNVRKKRNKRRKVLLNKKIDRVAARGDDDVSSAVIDHFFIFLFDYGCADCGFLGAEKAEVNKSLFHGRYSNIFIVCNK